MPIQWILFLTQIFNTVLYTVYSQDWCFSRIVTLLKKGNLLDCGNYRGISLMNCIPKIYDYILYNRLAAWFKPDMEQAGAQPKRGCMEHIISLRLLIDYAIVKKKKLYIVYVDFSKAYDRVPRGKLVHLLAAMGCGAIMLAALASMYKVSYGIIGITVITCTIGVRQGSPTSCFLFTMYVNPLLRKLKSQCQNDGFLQWLHALMLMDDTVLLASDRDKCLEKVDILLDFCNDSGMVINEGKTKFMVINGTDMDRQDLIVKGNNGSINIGHCMEYNYLGCWFLSDGKVSSAVKKHANDKQKHYMKLVSFLNKNRDFPFCVKKKVVDSAFMAAILYGCESWFTQSHFMNSLYLGAIKALLGVRKTTSSDLCLIEVGYAPLKDYVQQKQKMFFQKMISERDSIPEDPLRFCIHLTMRDSTRLGRYLKRLIATDSDIEKGGQFRLRSKVQSSERSKFVSYVKMNPSLDVHKLYSNSTDPVSEYSRVSFSRFRLSAHNLRIETGRWSRTPRQERYCECNSSETRPIQDEQHVIKDCPLTHSVRLNYPSMDFSIPAIFEEENSSDKCDFIHNVLLKY